MMSIRVVAAVGLILCATAHASDPAIRLVPTEHGVGSALEIANLDPAILAALKRKPPADWTAIFSVRVASAETAILGTYRIEKGVLRFEPRFPLVPGLKYRVNFDPAKLPGGTGKEVIVAEVSVPKPAAAPTAIVEQIYPSRDDLPEN